MWQVKIDFVLFPIHDHRMRLRFEVLFKKIHPRRNLRPLFLRKTKNLLLNTITSFLGHENRSLGPKQQNLSKPLLGGYLAGQMRPVASSLGLMV
jgi:hypothetical protein